jgi:hypothetical protein
MAVTRKIYRDGEQPVLTPEQVEELNALKGREIDLSDAPETTDWSKAKRGRFAHKAILAEEHQAATQVRVLDADVASWLSTQDQETKRHINDMIRHVMALAH